MKFSPIQGLRGTPSLSRTTSRSFQEDDFRGSPQAYKSYCISALHQFRGLGIIEHNGRGFWNDSELGSGLVKPLQAGDAVFVKAVPDVFVQEFTAGRGEGLVIGIMGAGYVVECGNPCLACIAQGLQMCWGQDIGPTRPEAENEGKSC